MSTDKNVFTAAVVALVVSIAVLGLYVSTRSEAPVVAIPAATQEVTAGDSLGGNTGPVYNGVQNFPDGHSDGGTFATITADGEINAGANQASWTNRTGRTVYVNPGDVKLGYTAGTASSSLLFYVSTSTATSVTDYARPTATLLLLDGAVTATSTGTAGGPRFFTGTSTDLGTGVSVPAGSRIVFNVQERYGCKTIGACETATSTNRGITKFFWSFKGTYKP